MADSTTPPPAPRISPAPSPLEAAAIVAAIECFARDTAPAPAKAAAAGGGWLAAARAEAVARAPRRAGRSGDWRAWNGRSQPRPN
jgi:hypothetical protein